MVVPQPLAMMAIIPPEISVVSRSEGVYIAIAARPTVVGRTDDNYIYPFALVSARQNFSAPVLNTVIARGWGTTILLPV